MKQLTALLLCVLLTTGCASIVSGRYQDVMVRSNPAHANVYVDGMPVGNTPLTTSLLRKRRHDVKLTKEGYRDAFRQTRRSYNPWNLGNILIGGLIGLAVDLVTGAIYRVEPDEISVNLERV